MAYPVICIDGSITLHNFVPVQEHTVVLQEGKTYNVIDYFYYGPWLFYILEGMGMNAYDSTMFLTVATYETVEAECHPLVFNQPLK